MNKDKKSGTFERALLNKELIPEPTYKFNIGDEVKIGNLLNVHVIDILEDNKIYRIQYDYIETNYGNPRLIEDSNMLVRWYEIRPSNNIETNNIIKNENFILNYSPRTIQDILGKKYNFGLDLNPEYQRDYVWEESDRFALIDSIFNNIDIGKFVFAKLEWDDRPDHYGYEIIDGKQRVITICDFFENKFPYGKLYYNDLSHREQYYFFDYRILTTELSHLTKENKIKYFIILNTVGKTMDKGHLLNVKKMLEK